MENKIVRAYLMQEVIRLGFLPVNPREQKNWLLQYGRSLKDFWEIDDYPPAPGFRGKSLTAIINSSEHVQVAYEYAIERVDKFTVNFTHLLNDWLIWTHDMDGGYFCFPHQSFLSSHKEYNLNLAIQKMDRKDIERIVDTLLVHPTPHQHIKSPIDNHEIRMGGGITNSFLYLFHLRIQLCPILERRVAEKARLIDLFEVAIKKNEIVKVSELMKVPS